MLARIRKSAEEKDQGFTLIELLVVMIIIGILAAIAIPVFLSQRAKARDASAKSDVQAIATEVAGSITDGNPAAAVAATNTTAGTDLSFVVSGTTYTSKVSPGNITKVSIATTGAWCASVKTSDAHIFRITDSTSLASGAEC